MADPLLNSVSTRRFAEIAEQYVALINAHETFSRGEFLLRAQALLPVLYSAALALPRVEPSDDERESRLTHEQWNTLYRALQGKTADRDYYAEVFDPYNFEEPPVTGSLADDFADIYRDLLAGFAYWQVGQATDAVWTWRFHFESHWGEHATGALRAIHTLAYTYDLYEPSVLPPRA